jgi:hypothetical protein
MAEKDKYIASVLITFMVVMSLLFIIVLNNRSKETSNNDEKRLFCRQAHLQIQADILQAETSQISLAHAMWIATVVSYCTGERETRVIDIAPSVDDLPLRDPIPELLRVRDEIWESL